MNMPHCEALASHLDHIAATIRKHVIFQSDHDADAIAVWIAGSYLMDHWSRFPKLLIVSPERECGKTTALQAIELFAQNAKLASSITPSAVYRLIQREAPTLLIDEADLTLKHSEELQAIVNAGHTRRGAKKVISHKTSSGNWEPVEMSLWCAQVIAGIGEFADTLTSRSIVIGLRRKGANEHVDYLSDRLFDEFRSFRQQLEQDADAIQSQQLLEPPPMPPQAVNRVGDNWTPLFQIAELAGDQWPAKITRAFHELEVERKRFGAIPTDSDLLADIREVLTDYIAPEIPSSELLHKLLVLSEGDWHRANSGRDITSRWLATKLRPYGVVPHRRAAGNVYMLSDLQDAMKRYLSPIQSQKPTQHTQVTC